MKVTRFTYAIAIASIAFAPLALSAQAPAAKTAGSAKTAAAQSQAPAAASNQAPAATNAATEQAKCKDGSMYSGTSRQGACSSHGGVATWLTGSKNAAVPKGATARCNDNTYYTKAERKGACTGHKGVAEWLGKKGS
jgi:hypothetical protein